MSVMLMLAFGSITANAQDSGTTTNSSSSTNTSVAPATPPAASNGATGGTVYHSSSSSSEEVQRLSTNTWILIAIGVIAFLVLITVMVRSRTSSSETTIIK